MGGTAAVAAIALVRIDQRATSGFALIETYPVAGMRGSQLWWWTGHGSGGFRASSRALRWVGGKKGRKTTVSAHTTGFATCLLQTEVDENRYASFCSHARKSSMGRRVGKWVSSGRAWKMSRAETELGRFSLREETRERG